MLVDCHEPNKKIGIAIFSFFFLCRSRDKSFFYERGAVAYWQARSFPKRHEEDVEDVALVTSR